MIDHFELFGLRQVYLRLRGSITRRRDSRQRALYGFVRHPIMLGFLIAFWADAAHDGRAPPVLDRDQRIHSGRIMLEERDLVRYIGPEYEAYRRRVPMLIPTGSRRD